MIFHPRVEGTIIWKAVSVSFLLLPELCTWRGLNCWDRQGGKEITSLKFPENNDLLSVQLFTEMVGLECCEGHTAWVKNSSTMKNPFHLTCWLSGWVNIQKACFWKEKIQLMTQFPNIKAATSMGHNATVMFSKEAPMVVSWLPSRLTCSACSDPGKMFWPLWLECLR